MQKSPAVVAFADSQYFVCKIDAPTRHVCILLRPGKTKIRRRKKRAPVSTQRATRFQAPL